MVNFAEGIIAMQEIGVADIILPFLLVFTIVFAVFRCLAWHWQFAERSTLLSHSTRD